MKTVDSIGVELRELLVQAVRKRPFEAILFSGGLDSSIVAALNPKAAGITVSLENEAEDISYANRLAQTLGMRHIHRPVSREEAIQALPEVIQILKSFDPALPNDLAAYFGLLKARGMGFHTLGTGDGSDELFGGYSFMAELENCEAYIARMSKTMSFSSNTLAEFLGLELNQPFLDSDVFDLALKIPISEKIRADHGKTWGKWILRKTFESMLPPELAWQSKRPLEIGSGMTRLREIIESRVSDHDFQAGRGKMHFFNKEHFYYYRIYREVVGEIPLPQANEKICPGCGTGVNLKKFHCKLCGYVMDWRSV